MADGLARLREWGIPSVNFFCDNVRLFRQVPDAFRGFDLNWVPEAKGVDLYRRAGLRHLHAPMPCWVDPRWRTPPTGESLPATFVGTRDGQRERLFAEAYAKGLDMDLRGLGWDGQGPGWPDPEPGRGARLLANQWDFVARHGWVALMRKAAQRVFPAPEPHADFAARSREHCVGDEYWRGPPRVPGVHRRQPVSQSPPFLRRPDRYSRLRDLEAPMAGAAYLTEAAPGLDALYEIGREIETYRDASELAEKAAALGGDAARRRGLRVRGQRRALADHTIERTLSRITELLGIR